MVSSLEELNTNYVEKLAQLHLLILRHQPQVILQQKSSEEEKSNLAEVRPWLIYPSTSKYKMYHVK